MCASTASRRFIRFSSIVSGSSNGMVRISAS
jgi:hypothetical protein